MRLKSHARCGAGEKPEITSKVYLLLFEILKWWLKRERFWKERELYGGKHATIVKGFYCMPDKLDEYEKFMDAGCKSAKEAETYKKNGVDIEEIWKAKWEAEKKKIEEELNSIVYVGSIGGLDMDVKEIRIFIQQGGIYHTRGY